MTGRSGSGKTFTTVPLIRSHIIPQVNKVYAIVSTFSQVSYRVLDEFIDPEALFSTASESVFRLIKEKIHENNFALKILLIIDDQAGVQALNSGRKGTFAELIPNALHWNLTIVVMTQNVTSVTPTLRDNADFLMAFYTSNSKEMDILKKEFNPSFLTKDAFLVMYYAALGGVERPQEKYAFLFVALKPPLRFFRKFTERLLLEEWNL